MQVYSYNPKAVFKDAIHSKDWTTSLAPMVFSQPWAFAIVKHGCCVGISVMLDGVEQLEEYFSVNIFASPIHLNQNIFWHLCLLKRITNVLLPEQSSTRYLSTVIIHIALYESTGELRSDGMWCLETSAVNVEIAIIPCMDGRRPKDHNTKIRTHSILEPWGHRNSPCSLVV